MNSHPTVTKNSTKWAAEFDLDLKEFDEWMTRQLNCLVGRNLHFATPQMQASSRNPDSTEPRSGG